MGTAVPLCGLCRFPSPPPGSPSPQSYILVTSPSALGPSVRRPPFATVNLPVPCSFRPRCRPHQHDGALGHRLDQRLPVVGPADGRRALVLRGAVRHLLAGEGQVVRTSLHRQRVAGLGVLCLVGVLGARMGGRGTVTGLASGGPCVCGQEGHNARQRHGRWQWRVARHQPTVVQQVWKVRGKNRARGGCVQV